MVSELRLGCVPKASFSVSCFVVSGPLGNRLRSFIIASSPPLSCTRDHQHVIYKVGFTFSLAAIGSSTERMSLSTHIERVL